MVVGREREKKGKEMKKEGKGEGKEGSKDWQKWGSEAKFIQCAQIAIIVCC